MYAQRKIFYDPIKSDRKGSVKQRALYGLNKRVMHLVRYRNLTSSVPVEEFNGIFGDKPLKRRFLSEMSVLRGARKERRNF